MARTEEMPSVEIDTLEEVSAGAGTAIQQRQDAQRATSLIAPPRAAGGTCPCGCGMSMASCNMKM